MGLVSNPSPAASNDKLEILPVCSSNVGVIVAAVVGVPLILTVGIFLYPKP